MGAVLVKAISLSLFESGTKSCPTSSRFFQQISQSPPPTLFDYSSLESFPLTDPATGFHWPSSDVMDLQVHRDDRFSKQNHLHAIPTAVFSI